MAGLALYVVRWCALWAQSYHRSIVHIWYWSITSASAQSLRRYNPVECEVDGESQGVPWKWERYLRLDKFLILSREWCGGDGGWSLSSWSSLPVDHPSSDSDWRRREELVDSSPSPTTPLRPNGTLRGRLHFCKPPPVRPSSSSRRPEKYPHSRPKQWALRRPHARDTLAPICRQGCPRPRKPEPTHRGTYFGTASFSPRRANAFRAVPMLHSYSELLETWRDGFKGV